MSIEDDYLYLKILIASCALACCSKRLKQNRASFNGICGVALVIVVCGWQLMYSLTCVLVNLILIRFVRKRRLHHWAFVWTFGYLAFSRCSLLCGLPKLLPHANAVQLIITLRCIGLAFEIHDGSEDSKKEGKHRRPMEQPSILEAFLYLYNFAGLFTGPYFTYEVHCDMVKSDILNSVRVAHEVMPRLLITPVYIAILLLVSLYFPVEFVHDDRFYELGFLARLCYMVPVFVFLRTRCYVAWTLSETSCIVNGLGVYPETSKPTVGHGPTHMEGLNQKPVDGQELVYSFETVRNVDAYGCEFRPGFRSRMRCWNRSVQYWLAAYVYKRAPKSIRMPLTMLVSAFWHGIHPGYYLSFLTIPLCTLAEDLMFKQHHTQQQQHKKKDHNVDNVISVGSFDFKWWFFSMRGFDYMAMGFLLLSWTSTVNYWASISYIVHVVLAFCIGYCYVRHRLVGPKKFKEH